MEHNPPIGPINRQIKKCSYCGRENPEGAEFCSECGTRFATNSPATAQEKTASFLTNATQQPRPPVVQTPRQPKDFHLDLRNKCSYCGRENVDEAESCSECGSRLTPRSTSVVDAKSPELQTGILPSSEIINSDNPWVAKDAWKCIGMFVVFRLGIGQMLRAVEVLLPGFRYFAGTGAGHAFYSIIYFTVDILTALYFARIESLESFLKAFGLAKPPSPYVKFAVAVTLIIRLTGHWMITSGLSKGVRTGSTWGFTHSVGIESLLYLLPLLMAPFAEELYMRGFFYRAFRGSHSVLASTLLILGITAWTHWVQYRQSWIAAVDLSALTVLQCFLRERTGNLRDCIICHLVYNGSGALLVLRVH